MSLPTRNLRHALKSFVPNWMADNLASRVLFTFLFIICLFGDLIVEAMLQGLFAAWPGKGTNTALPYIGASRGFIKGVSETDDEYAARLRGWLDIWPEAGSDATLGSLIQGYLGGGLVVRVVDRRGRFTTINANGTISVVTDVLWNFDATELPERTAWWSDLWIIVYLDSRWPIYVTLSDPAWLAAWGTTTNGGVGHQVPRGIVRDIAVLMSVFKGAHSWIETLVFTTDSAIFIPGALGATYPDGRWGAYSREIAGVQTLARPNTSGGGILRYWDPGSGG